MHKHVFDPKRISKKATFHNSAIKRLVRKYLPANITIPSDNHIDLTYYRTGHYFKIHQDYVGWFPENGIQVTIIIGLLTTKDGATSIRVDDKLQKYKESISKGGLLIFDSKLPHAGEPVIGEKEILVLTGYAFTRNVASPQATLQFSDYYRCIAIYSYTLDNDEAHEYPLPYLVDFYIYHSNKLRITCRGTPDNIISSVLIDNTNLPEIHNFEEEQLRLMSDPLPFLSKLTAQYNPALDEILKKKGLMKILNQLDTSKTDYEIHNSNHYEMCNGGDDYELVNDSYINYTCTKTFSFTMYNKHYYNYWLTRIGRMPTGLTYLITRFIIC